MTLSKLPTIFFIILFCAGCWLPLRPQAASAQVQSGFEVSPHIINEKANARDIFDYQVKIANNSSSTVNLYVVVNDISDKEGMKKAIDPAYVDKTNSLSRWISISRGVIDLKPGESKEVPLNIKVNMNAAPGVYYAAITYAPGSNRYDAEALALTANLPQTIITFEVASEVVEKSQLAAFRVLRNTYFSFPAEFSLDIKNVGNSAIEPTGFIHIYNRRGIEAGTLELNADKKIIEPEASGNFSLSWQGSGFGKFKARLEAEYGTKDKRDLQDTVYFYVLPWYLLAVIALLAIVLAGVVAWYVSKANTLHHRSMVEQSEDNFQHDESRRMTVEREPQTEASAPGRMEPAAKKSSESVKQPAKEKTKINPVIDLRKRN